MHFQDEEILLEVQTLFERNVIRIKADVGENEIIMFSNSLQSVKWLNYENLFLKIFSSS